MQVEKVEEIPVVKQYRYLGLIFDQKLTIHAHMEHINRKILFQVNALSKILPNITAGYRKSLWMTFIKPMYELASLLYQSDSTMTNKNWLERIVTKSFKRIVGLGKTTPTELVQSLSGYRIQERAKILWDEANKKWHNRMQGNTHMTKVSISRKTKDLLKNITQEGIKLINLLNKLCPICKNQKMTIKHLKLHRIYYPEITQIFMEINRKVEQQKQANKKSKLLKRREIVITQNKRCDEYIEEINKFMLFHM